MRTAISKMIFTAEALPINKTYRINNPKKKKSQNKISRKSGTPVESRRQPRLAKLSASYGGGHFGQNSLSARNGHLQVLQIFSCITN